MLMDDPLLECDWSKVLPVYNSTAERNRVIGINPNLRLANYPLTREYLNNYYKNNKFNISNYSSAFYFDCAASMYSYFIMTFGYDPNTGGNPGPGALPAVPGGQGVSFGFNPFFGLFNIDSPVLWIILIALGAIVVKKVID